MKKHLLFLLSFSCTFYAGELTVSYSTADDTIQLQVSNHSEKLVTFFNTTGVSKPDKPLTLYQSIAPRVSLKDSTPNLPNTSSAPAQITPRGPLINLRFSSLSDTHRTITPTPGLTLEQRVANLEELESKSQSFTRCASHMVAPYEDSEIIKLLRQDKTYINTCAGTYLLKKRKKEPMQHHMVLHALQSKKQEDGWKNIKELLQKMMPGEDKDMIVVVEPDGLAKIVSRAKQTQDKLFKAILADSAEDIKKAVQAGADVNYERDGKVLLFWAVAARKINAVEALLDCGADIDKEIDLVLQARGPEPYTLENIRLVQMLVKKGKADLSKSIMELCHFALYSHQSSESPTRASRLSLMQDLIAQGCDVNDGLYKALSQPAFVELFLKNGADPNYISVSGNNRYSMLGVAASRKDGLATVKLLLAAGANVNQKSFYQSGSSAILERTPLENALMCKDPDIVALLLEHDAHL